MKRKLIILAVALLLMLSACSSGALPADSNQTGGGEQAEKKVLVAYYSATGSTRSVAEEIAKDTGATLFEIEPAETYTQEDLNYSDDQSRASTEHLHPDQRDVALISPQVPDWSDYTTVFIGYPIWWGEAAYPVESFVSLNDFSGKTVIPFCTSSSSPIGSSGEKLEEVAGTGDWEEGHRFPSSASADEVKNWMDSLKLDAAS